MNIDHANNSFDCLTRSLPVFKMEGCFLLCDIFDIICFRDLRLPPTDCTEGVCSLHLCVSQVIRCLGRVAAPAVPALRRAGMNEAQGPYLRGPPLRLAVCAAPVSALVVGDALREWGAGVSLVKGS